MGGGVGEEGRSARVKGRRERNRPRILKEKGWRKKTPNNQNPCRFFICRRRNFKILWKQQNCWNLGKSEGGGTSEIIRSLGFPPRDLSRGSISKSIGITSLLRGGYRKRKNTD